jgi:hypothetical protein
MLAKIGPGTNVQRRSRNVRGHQIRRELNALEDEAQRLRDGAHHQRLRGARQPGDQAMAADKKRDQDLVEHVLLPHDDLAHLAQNAVANRLKTLDAFLQFRGIRFKLRDGGH